jgi:hypothetical protein
MVLALLLVLLSATATPSAENPDFDLGPALNTKTPDIGTPSDFSSAPPPSHA